MSDKYYTPPEVGKLFRVSGSTANLWFRLGHIKYHRLPRMNNNDPARHRMRRATREELIEFAERFGMPVPKELLDE